MPLKQSNLKGHFQTKPPTTTTSTASSSNASSSTTKNPSSSSSSSSKRVPSESSSSSNGSSKRVKLGTDDDDDDEEEEHPRTLEDIFENLTKEQEAAVLEVLEEAARKDRLNFPSQAPPSLDFDSTELDPLLTIIVTFLQHALSHLTFIHSDNRSFLSSNPPQKIVKLVSATLKTPEQRSFVATILSYALRGERPPPSDPAVLSFLGHHQALPGQLSLFRHGGGYYRQTNEVVPASPVDRSQLPSNERARFVPIGNGEFVLHDGSRKLLLGPTRSLYSGTSNNVAQRLRYYFNNKSVLGSKQPLHVRGIASGDSLISDPLIKEFFAVVADTSGTIKGVKELAECIMILPFLSSKPKHVKDQLLAAATTFYDGALLPLFQVLPSLGDPQNEQIGLEYMSTQWKVVVEKAFIGGWSHSSLSQSQYLQMESHFGGLVVTNLPKLSIARTWGAANFLNSPYDETTPPAVATLCSFPSNERNQDKIRGYFRGSKFEVRRRGHPVLETLDDWLQVAHREDRVVRVEVLGAADASTFPLGKAAGVALKDVDPENGTPLGLSLVRFIKGRRSTSGDPDDGEILQELNSRIRWIWDQEPFLEDKTVDLNKDTLTTNGETLKSFVQNIYWLFSTRKKVGEKGKGKGKA